MTAWNGNATADAPIVPFIGALNATPKTVRAAASLVTLLMLFIATSLRRAQGRYVKKGKGTARNVHKARRATIARQAGTSKDLDRQRCQELRSTDSSSKTRGGVACQNRSLRLEARFRTSAVADR